MANSPPHGPKPSKAFRRAAEEVEALPTTTIKAVNGRSAPKDRIPAEQNYGSAEVRELGRPDARDISHYCISFYNEISDSTGNISHVCQRKVEVETGLGEDEAISLAIMEFEKLEKTSSWTTHARTLECTQLV